MARDDGGHGGNRCRGRGGHGQRLRLEGIEEVDHLGGWIDHLESIFKVQYPISLVKVTAPAMLELKSRSRRVKEVSVSRNERWRKRVIKQD